MGRLRLEEGKTYTFKDYFDFNVESEEVAEVLGYTLQEKCLNLPQTDYPEPEEVERLRRMLLRSLPQIGKHSEMAKREFMIAPVLLALMQVTQLKVKVEYPLRADDRLGGSLDYLIRSTRNMVVLEAKRDDLDNGFSQLIAEMVALDQAEGEGGESDTIYGAVSIGEVWRFGVLHRQTRNIERDVQIYSVPNDLEALLGVLLGILQAK